MEKLSPRFKLPPASIQWRDDSIDFYFAGQLEDYRVMNKLGQGQYGIVKLGVHVATGERVALKIINKADLTEAERASLKREAEVMSFLNHRSIIHTVCVIENRINLCLVMEFAAGGELFDHIIRQTKLKEVEARNLFVQMLEGIGYCHSKGIIHRDIKAENIFLDEKLELVKIGDFGFSSVVGDEKEEEACGSLDYAAPEILGARNRPGPEGDVWALGVVLYFMITGTLPFKAATDFDVYQKIRKADYRPLPSSTTPDLVNVIKLIFEPNPLNRPTIAAVLQQTWCQQAFKDPEYLKHPKMSRMLQLQIKQNFQVRVKKMSKSDAAAHGETTGALSPRSLIASVSAPSLNITASSSSGSSASTSSSAKSSDVASMSLSSKVAAAKLARARSSQKAATPPAAVSNPVIHEDKTLSPTKRSSVKTSSSRDSKSKRPKPKHESSNELKAPEAKDTKSQRGSKKKRQRHEILEEDEEGVTAVDPQDSPRRHSISIDQPLPAPIESLIPQLIPIPKGGDKLAHPSPDDEASILSIPFIHMPSKDISDDSHQRTAPPPALPSLNLPSSRVKLATSSPQKGRKPASPLPVSTRDTRKSSSRPTSQKNSPTTSPTTSPRTKKALKDGQQSPPRKGSYSARTSRSSVRMSDFSIVKVSQEQLDKLIANKDVEVLSVEKDGDANVVVLSAPAARNRINTVRDVLLLEQFEKNATRLKRSKSTENVSLASSIFGTFDDISKSQGHTISHNRKSSQSALHGPRDVDSPARPRVSPQERPELSNLKRPHAKKTRSNSYNHEMFRDLLAKKREDLPDGLPRRSDSIRRRFDSAEFASPTQNASEVGHDSPSEPQETSK